MVNNDLLILLKKIEEYRRVRRHKEKETCSVIGREDMEQIVSRDGEC